MYVGYIFCYKQKQNNSSNFEYKDKIHIENTFHFE